MTTSKKDHGRFLSHLGRQPSRESRAFAVVAVGEAEDIGEARADGLIGP